MRIVVVDPSDATAVAALHRIYVTVGQADNPQTFVAAPVAEIREVLAAPTARLEFTAFLGFAGDEPVASGWAALGRRDAPHLAYLTPRVLPQQRRRGHGSRVLAAMERHAAAHGRTLLLSSAVWAAEHGPDGSGSAPVGFAAARGFRLAHTSVRLKLELPTDRGRLDALLAQRAARRAGYTTRSWVGPVPQELLAGWAVLHAMLSEDEPHGELERPAETPDPDAIRDDERILAESGRVKVNAAVLSPAGALVAFSSILTRIRAPDAAFQQGTVVDRNHRGRGLGALAKVAALRLLEETRPDITAVVTENAQDNGHILELNRAVGCVPVLYSGDFQRHLTAPAALH